MRCLVNSAVWMLRCLPLSLLGELIIEEGRECVLHLWHFFYFKGSSLKLHFLLLKLTKFNDDFKILLWEQDFLCSFHRKCLAWPWILGFNTCRSCNPEVLETWKDKCTIFPCPAVNVHRSRALQGVWILQGQEGHRPWSSLFTWDCPVVMPVWRARQPSWVSSSAGTWIVVTSVAKREGLCEPLSHECV